MEHRGQQQTQEKDNQIRRSEVRVQFDRRARIFLDQPRILQTDEGNEQADPSRNRIFQTRADCVEDQFPQPDHRKDQEQDTGNKDGPQRHLPAIRKACRRGRWNCREYEEKILPHPRRLRNRIVGIQCHDGRSQRRRETSGGRHRAEIHARGMIKHRPGQYGRLDKDDVGHRQKSRDPRQQFRARVGLIF